MKNNNWGRKSKENIESAKLLINNAFGNINAPAIIYPFIREHLSNLTIKAGVHPILLPPVNFVKLYQDKSNNV